MIPVRERRTDSLNRARVALELKRGLRPAMVIGLGILLALAIAGYIGAQVSRTLTADTFEVSFAVDDVTGVVPGQQDARVKGIQAGTIKSVETDGTQPIVTVELQQEYGPVYRDARAQLRPSSALQDIYLDVVDRGRPSAGEADPARPLPAAQTATPVKVDEVLHVFQPDERAGLMALLDNLGNGLEDRGASLRTAFVQVVPLLEVAGRISDQLAERRPMTERLVHNTAILTGELSRRDQELRTLVDDGGKTLTTLQAGREDLDATLRELPPTLTAVDSSFAAVRGVTGDVDRALIGLRPVAGQVGPALRDVRALNASAGPAVRTLQEPVRRLVPLSEALRPLSANLRRAVRFLRPQIDTVDKVTRDLAICKRGVQGFFQYNISIVKFGDVRGASPRGNSVAGSPTSLTRPQACTPGEAIGGRPAEPEDEH